MYKTGLNFLDTDLLKKWPGWPRFAPFACYFWKFSGWRPPGPPIECSGASRPRYVSLRSMFPSRCNLLWLSWPSGNLQTKIWPTIQKVCTALQYIAWPLLTWEFPLRSAEQIQNIFGLRVNLLQNKFKICVMGLVQFASLYAYCSTVDVDRGVVMD